MTPNAFLLEMERFITHAFDNEQEFINYFVPELAGWTLEECYMASGRTRLYLRNYDGQDITKTILTLEFISWVNGNLAPCKKGK